MDKQTPKRGGRGRGVSPEGVSSEGVSPGGRGRGVSPGGRGRGVSPGGRGVSPLGRGAPPSAYRGMTRITPIVNRDVSSPPTASSSSSVTISRPPDSKTSSSGSGDGPPSAKSTPNPIDGSPTLTRKSSRIESRKTPTTATATASATSSDSCPCPPNQCTTGACDLIASLQSLNVISPHVIPLHPSSASAALPMRIWDMNMRNNVFTFDSEIAGSRSWEGLGSFPPKTLEKYKGYFVAEASKLGMSKEQIDTALILLSLQKESLQELVMVWKCNKDVPIEENFSHFRSMKNFPFFEVVYSIVPFDINAETEPEEVMPGLLSPVASANPTPVNASANDNISIQIQSDEEDEEEDDDDDDINEDPEEVDPVLVPYETVFQVVDNKIQVGVYQYNFRPGAQNRDHALFVCKKTEGPAKNRSQCTFKIKTTNSIEENGVVTCTYIETVNYNHLGSCRQKHIDQSSRVLAVKNMIAEKRRNNAPDLEPRVVGQYAYHLGYRYCLVSSHATTLRYRCSHCSFVNLILDSSSRSFISISNVHKDECDKDYSIVENKIERLKNYDPLKFVFNGDENNEAEYMDWLVKVHDEIVHCPYVEGSSKLNFGRPHVVEIMRLIEQSFPPNHKLCTLSRHYLSKFVWIEKRKRLTESEIKKWESDPLKLQKMVELIMTDDNIFIDWNFIANSLEEISVTSCSYGFTGYLSKKHPDALKTVSLVMVEKIFSASAGRNSIGLTLLQILSSLQTSIAPSDADQPILKAMVKHLLGKFSGERKRLNYLKDTSSFIWNSNYKAASNSDWHKGITNELKISINSYIAQLRSKSKDDQLSYDSLSIVQHHPPNIFYLGNITADELMGQEVQLELEKEDDGIIGDLLGPSASADMTSVYSTMATRGEIQYEGVNEKDSIEVSEGLMKDEKLQNTIFQFGYYLMQKEGEPDRLVFVFTSTGSLHLSVAKNLVEMLRGSGCYSIYRAYAVEGFKPDLDSFKLLALCRGIKAAFEIKWLSNLLVINRNNYRECAVGNISKGLLLFMVKRLHAAGAIINDSTRDWLKHSEVLNALARNKITLNFSHRPLLNKYNIAFMKTFQ